MQAWPVEGARAPERQGSEAQLATQEREVDWFRMVGVGWGGR